VTEYRGDIGLANRLFAARRAAGFRSARAAAAKFAWNEGVYRSYESATRSVPDDLLPVYARIFGVAEEWLRTGRGRGPAPSATRSEIFRLRVKAAKARASAGAAPGKRLRLARRLAGFKTVTDAATHYKITRTTLNAHETGQNLISEAAARIYALAFGTNAKWIMEGVLPAGYPREIERLLDGLLDLHFETEREARRQLPKFVAKRGDPAEVGAREQRRPPTPVVSLKGDQVPELAPDQIESWLKERSGQAAASRLWSFPEGYLSETIGCDPSAAIMVALPYPVEHYRRFDRLIIDTRAKNPVAGSSYLLIFPGAHLDLYLPRGQGADPSPPAANIVGRVCGTVAAAR
jgi:hypothetical protein